MATESEASPTMADDYADLFSVLQSSPGAPRRRSQLPGMPLAPTPTPPPPQPAPPSQVNEKPSDIVFLVAGQRFTGHKEIICRASPYFGRQLSQVMHLAAMDIEIEIRDCHPAIFGKILQFMYTAQTELTPQEVWELHAKAEMYEMAQLASKCQEYIMTFTSPDNVWQVHAMAVEMGADTIAERCLQYANMLKQQQQAQQTQRPTQVSSQPPPQGQMYTPMSISQAGSPAAGVAKAPPSPMGVLAARALQTAPQQQPTPQQVYPEQWPHERHSSFEAPPAASTSCIPSPMIKSESPSSPSDAPLLRKEIRLDDPQSRAATLEWALEHLNVLSNMVKTLLDADRISLFLYNEDTNELCALLDNMCEIRIPVGNGIAGAVFTSGKMINSRDPYSDSRFLMDVDKQTGYKTLTILCMPIILSNGRVSGVIEVLNKRSRAKPGQRVFFTKQDETTLDHVCRLSGNLLERIPEYVHSIQIQEDGSLARNDPASRAKRTADARSAVGYKRNKRNSIPIFHFKLPGKSPS